MTKQLQINKRLLRNENKEFFFLFPYFIYIDSCQHINPRNWLRCDVAIDNCSLAEMSVHRLRIKNDVRERMIEFFWFCRVINDWFLEKSFVYEQRYPLEISMATEVIDHADSEYAILFFSELICQNPSTMEIA